jgi:uncharacterized protein
MTRPTMAGIIVTALIIFSLWYIAMCAYLYFQQHSLIYFPDTSRFEQCANFIDAQKIVHNGTRMYYKDNGNRLAIFYHGNAGTACESRKMKDFLEEQGYSYLFVEYAGYANDPRKPSMGLILQDVRNAAGFAKAKHPKKVVVIGESLGSGAASYHTFIASPDAAVLIVPFNSFRGLAKEKYPLFPVSSLLTETYDNGKWLERYQGNVLIIHGDADTTISQRHSRELFSLLPSKNKTYASIEGADHNSVYDSKKTWDALREAMG